ncbi:MAG: FAD-linked oxidase C-terminal domain-containing protein [Bacteroidia bacterium]|nr:FAD-linked oxidase C-terminal domain-containing protein [Bacteroidia bacterium]
MNWIESLEKIVGKEIVFTDPKLLSNYSSDYTEDIFCPPDAVVIPRTTLEVSLVLSFCNENKIPVTPRGAGTGLSGGSIPVRGGVSLSMEKFNRIIEIDEKNFQSTVESGVINDHFQTAVKEKGLFYPPDPASKGSCFLGGNIAHSSGGPKALKYGTTKDYVLNLEVVLPNGDIIWTGSDTLKNSTGYNFTQLFLGSEGTLGIVTKIVFKLLPLPKHDLLMLAKFDSIKDACKTVPQIFTQGVQPSALELMERNAIEFVHKHGSESQKSITQDMLSKDSTEAFLLIEVDGNEMDNLFTDCEKINEVLELNNTTEVQFADSSDQKERIWQIRRNIGEMVKLHSIFKEEDTVVKRANLPKLMTGVKSIGENYNFESVCYGHAGDGNLHINIIKGSMSAEQWNGKHLEEGIRKIFRLCKELGGTISGEHGIGLVQKKYMNEVLTDTHIDLMKGIKHTFDPNGILNPDKIWE